MMDTISNTDDQQISSGDYPEIDEIKERNPNGKPSFSSDNLSLTAEGGMFFFRYLKTFDLFKEPELLILSTNSHFYYDENDLKNVKTILNLKKLNVIKDLHTLLQTVFNLMPPYVNFVGCFSDSKAPTGNDFFSELSSKLANLLDARTDHSMSKKEVTAILGEHGFKVIDMTDMNGITFFYSQKVPGSVEKKH